MDDVFAAFAPGGIERQEAQGQRNLCASLRLPTTMQDCTRADFESLGFEFGEDVDALFVEARFPAGWSLRPTGHSMWSDLVDDQGETRFRIFYKAAFYDHRAFIAPA